MFPQVIASRVYIPAIRAGVVQRLRRHRWDENKIARALGITQAAVSKKLRYNKWVEDLKQLGTNTTEINVVISAIFNFILENRLEEAGTLINRYWYLLLASGDICRIHRERFRWWINDCNICMRTFFPEIEPTRAAVLANVERALIILKHSNTFASVIPEVLSNIVMSVPGARGINDVAGIPGRISRSGGRVIVREKPSFGASRHLAEVLLASRIYRAAINIRFNEKVEEALKKLGFRYVKFTSSKYPSRNPAAEAIKELYHVGKLTRAVIDTGGEGIEPVTYIFGANAVEVATIAVEVSRLHAESYDKYVLQ